MNPRRMAIEDRALALANRLDQENGQLAARLRESVPDSFGLCDEHAPLLRQALQAVAAANTKYTEGADKVLAAMDNLPAHIGRRGRVWISQDQITGSYSAFWDDDDWLEQGPRGVSRQTALDWAAPRASDIRISEHRV